MLHFFNNHCVIFSFFNKTLTFQKYLFKIQSIYSYHQQDSETVMEEYIWKKNLNTLIQQQNKKK